MRRWSAHPWRARALRLLVYGLPVVLSLALVHLATSLLTPPTASLWIFLAWWLGVSLLATVVVSVVYALSRRLLPLGALLELSLVFPDQAPSRFELALRTGTVESLVERLRVMRETREAPSTQEAAEILLRLVAALSIHDAITRGHAERVRAYSYLLGTQLGLSRHELDSLNWAALLHDVGKLEVSPEILNKSGKPTDEEWQQLRRHPEYGEMLVEPLREWLGEWAEAVGHHHERWDGKGYPRGLAGEEISRAGRIVAIADVYDVITSARSYKKPASTADARAEIVRCAGAQFDERYVRAFVDVSLTRMRLVLGPLSWLTHAPVLARIPLTQSVGATLGGLAAVAAATTTALAGAAEAPQAAAVRNAAPPIAATVAAEVRRAGRPTLVRKAPDGTLRRAHPSVPGPKRRSPDKPGSSPDAPASGSPEQTNPGGSQEPAPPGDSSPDPSRKPQPPPGTSPAPPSQPPSDPSPAPPSSPPASPPPSPPASSPPPTPPPPAPPPPPPPNQPPSFTAAGDQSVLEDAGPQSVGWATAISPGPARESSQTVTFAVSSTNSGLFSAQPAVSSGGTLTYTPAANAFGSATVTVVAHDNGGTANGGDDSSAAVTFAITVVPVNDAPSFNGGGNQTVISALGSQSVSGWATGISPGPANEASQSVSFVVTTNKPELFVVQPAVSPDGTLTYTPKLLALGTATVTVRVVDSGGTANGGVNTSGPQSCTLTMI